MRLLAYSQIDCLQPEVEHIAISFKIYAEIVHAHI